MKPQTGDYNPYYGQYISLIEDDVINVLKTQLQSTIKLLKGIDEEKGNFSYAEGKWTIKELLGHVIEVGELSRRNRPAAFLTPNAVHPGHDLPVELGAAAHGVVDSLAPLDQPGQDVIDIADRKRIVGTVLGAGALGAGPIAVPQLHAGILFATEHHELAVPPPGDQHQNCIGLGKA